MPQIGYPDHAALALYLQNECNSQGFNINPTTQDLDTKLQAAIEQFENETGWKPFLQDQANVVRTFDPPGARGAATSSDQILGGGRALVFGAGLMALTSVVTGITTTTPNGTAQILNQDFRLLPSNASVEGRPWILVQFMQIQYGPVQSVQVTGQWGRVANCPYSVRNAILRQAARLFLEDYVVSEGPVQVITGADGSARRFFDDPFAPWTKQTEKVWAETVAAYYRVPWPAA